MKPHAVSDARSAMARLHEALAGGAISRRDLRQRRCPSVDGFALARRIKRDRRLRDPFRVILLTSAGRPGDAERCRRIGVDASLTKPVKHSDLLDTLATLVGVTTRRARARSAARSTNAAGRDRPLRILVAEDNPVNRKLVTTLLHKRGHTVKAVENGREAVSSDSSGEGARIRRRGHGPADARDGWIRSHAGRFARARRRLRGVSRSSR